MHKISVALCSIASKYIHSSLSVWYLSAAVKKNCKDIEIVEIVEGTVNESPDDLARRIIHTNPKVIGFSCYIWNITYVKKLISLVKSILPSAVIILGGPEAGYNAKELLLSEPRIDYIISGEGEKPLALLLNSIQGEHEILNIPGLCYRNQNSIVTAPPHISLEEPENPYTDEYFKSLNRRIAYLETSRGCPYSCAFCLSSIQGGVLFFDIKRAKREILLLANSGAKTVKFVDRTFNANRQRAKELISYIIENHSSAIPDGVCFHFEIAGDILDEETVTLLRSAPAGAIQLEIGLQSFNPKTLDAVLRKTDINKLTHNINRLTEKGNIHIHVDLIAGLPFEDMASFAESFNAAYALKPHMLQLGFLKLLHGARMRETPDAYPCLYMQNPPYEVLETPWLSHSELVRLHYAEDALNRLYNSGRFKRTLSYLLRRAYKEPFELFIQLGKFCASSRLENISLDSYINLIYSYFSSQKGIDRSVLRDTLVCDYISTNSSGRLPATLKIYDTALKRALKKMEKKKETRPQKGVKRGAGLLYSENCIAYSDYTSRNPVTGEYPLNKIPLSEL